MTIGHHITIHLQRLQDNAHARVVDGFIVLDRRLFLGAAGIRLLQRIIYERR